MTTIIVIVFIVGYLAIAFEHPLRINKAAPLYLQGLFAGQFMPYRATKAIGF
jgi:hypothetical protein